jgi:predicted oxidoreductase
MPAAEETFDVVVVGSGVAGLAAALEAAAAGARVAVLEREPTWGGASRMSGARCLIVDTPLQRAHGIVDDVEAALADLVAMGGPTADRRWARAYLAHSRTEVYDFCERLGIEWLSVTHTEGNSVPRWHCPAGWGRAIVDSILARAQAQGAQLICGAEVTDLVVDGRAVRGVLADVEGVATRYVASSVIVCAGGFAGNHAMVRRASPTLEGLPRVLAGSAPSATGQGRGILERAGAQFSNLDHVCMKVGTPDPQDPDGLRGLIVLNVAGSIWLNSKGRRFYDETRHGGPSATAAVLAQPGQTVWQVFTAAELSDVRLMDNEYWGSPGCQRPDAIPEFVESSAYVWQGDNPAELATAIGLPVDAVEQEVASFNAAIAVGMEAEPDFGRPLDGVSSLNGPGLVAIQLFPLSQKNLGGVQTDPECQVIGLDDVPIDGLFAAGEVAGMAGGSLNGQAALEGTMFGPCLYSGRVAGRAAVRPGSAARAPASRTAD